MGPHWTNCLYRTGYPQTIDYLVTTSFLRELHKRYADFLNNFSAIVPGERFIYISWGIESRYEDNLESSRN